MKAFKIGYIVTLSFFLIFSVASLTSGFFPPPKGPTAPEYPTYDTTTSLSDTSTSSMSGNLYQDNMQKYNQQKKQYDKDQKEFVQAKIVPYARNIFVGWIILITVFEAIGVLLVKLNIPLVGSAFAFSGVWAVVFGPLGCLILFISSLVSSFGGRANQTFSVEPISQAMGIASLIAIIALSFFGFLISSHLREELS